MAKGIAGQNINSGIAGLGGLNTSNFNTGGGLIGFVPPPQFNITPPPPEAGGSAATTTTAAPPSPAPTPPAAAPAPSPAAGGGAAGPAPGPLPAGSTGAQQTAAYQQYLAWATANNIAPSLFQDWLQGNFNAQPQAPSGAGAPIPQGGPEFNTLEFFQQFQQGPLEEALGRTINPNPRFFDPDSRGNLREFASGAFGGGQFGLPGQGADQTADLIFAQLISEAQKQAGRSGEQEDILRSLIGQSQGSAANQTSNSVQALLQQLANPASLDALDTQRRNDLDASIAGADNAAVNRLRDLGVLSGGGTSAANPLLALANNSARTRQQGLLDISNQRERDQLNRAQVAGAGAAQGADIFRALESDPQRTLAARLGGAENPAIAALIDTLGGFLNLQAGEAATQRGGSLFDDISPLLGQGIGAVGKIGAASLLGPAAPAAAGGLDVLFNAFS